MPTTTTTTSILPSAHGFQGIALSKPPRFGSSRGGVASKKQMQTMVTLLIIMLGVFSIVGGLLLFAIIHIFRLRQRVQDLESTQSVTEEALHRVISEKLDETKVKDEEARQAIERRLHESYTTALQDSLQNVMNQMTLSLQHATEMMEKQHVELMEKFNKLEVEVNSQQALLEMQEQKIMNLQLSLDQSQETQAHPETGIEEGSSPPPDNESNKARSFVNVDDDTGDAKDDTGDVDDDTRDEIITMNPILGVNAKEEESERYQGHKENTGMNYDEMGGTGKLDNLFKAMEQVQEDWMK